MYLLIPPDLIGHLDFVVGEEAAVIQDEEGKKGRYASLWKNTEDAKKIQDAKDML